MKKNTPIKLLLVVCILISAYFLLNYEKTSDQVIQEDPDSLGTAVNDNPSHPAIKPGDTNQQHQEASDTNIMEPEVQRSIEKLVNTSSKGLTEVTTDKGVSVDLQGRFHTAPVATINEQGEIIIQDFTSPPQR